MNTCYTCIKIGEGNSMDSKNQFDKLTKDFDTLVKEEKLNINSIEDLMLESIENYKKDLKAHVENLLGSHVKEEELIVKKNKNGKKRDIS